MAYEPKKTSVTLSKETQRQLNYICEQYGENSSRVVSRSIQMLYSSVANQKEDKDSAALV